MRRRWGPAKVENIFFSSYGWICVCGQLSHVSHRGSFTELRIQLKTSLVCSISVSSLPNNQKQSGFDCLWPTAASPNAKLYGWRQDIWSWGGNNFWSMWTNVEHVHIFIWWFWTWPISTVAVGVQLFVHIVVKMNEKWVIGDIISPGHKIVSVGWIVEKWVILWPYLSQLNVEHTKQHVEVTNKTSSPSRH